MCTSYRKFVWYNAAPPAAARIGVYDEDGQRVGYIPLGALEKAPSGAPSYRFGLISDAHCRSSSDESYASKLAHLRAALTRFSAAGLPFVAATGDVADTVSTSVLSEIVSVITSCGYAVGSTFLWGFGNHENQSATAVADRPAWMDERLGAGTGSFYARSYGGDVFAVMHFRRFGGVVGDPRFLDSDLDALEECLEQNTGRRVFLIEHALPCSGGPSDAEMSGHAGRYVDTTHWGNGDESTERFLSLITGRQNLIWLHGHSHYTFALQDPDTKYGCCALADRHFGGYSVHVPSLGMLKMNTAQDIDTAESESYVVSVYPEGLLLEGLDLADTAGTGTHALPAACIWLPFRAGSGTFGWIVSVRNGELYVDDAPTASVSHVGNELILEDANE